jgi:hypothetical protein
MMRTPATPNQINANTALDTQLNNAADNQDLPHSHGLIVPPVPKIPFSLDVCKWLNTRIRTSGDLLPTNKMEVLKKSHKGLVSLTIQLTLMVSLYIVGSLLAVASLRATASFQQVSSTVGLGPESTKKSDVRLLPGK